MSKFGSGKLSAQTKLLIAVVLAVAAFFAYYFLVYQNFNKQEAAVRSQISELHAQIDAEQIKVNSINVRKEAIEKGKLLNSAVEPADNSSSEWAVLSGHLKLNTLEYHIDNRGYTAGDVYTRRSMGVSFTAENMTAARTVIDSIADCGYRNFINNLTITANKGLDGNEEVQCTFTVVFIESSGK